MSFKMLYPEDGDVQANLRNIAVYLNAFAKKMGLQSLQCDSSALTAIAASLTKPDFPHIDGLAKASPFKKAAYFFVWFVVSRPIKDELPQDLIGEKLAGISNHQNVIFAYHICVDALHGANIYKADGEIVRLANRITVSEHFFCDFVEAFSTVIPANHFPVVSLLFEQLAYKNNREASYPETI